MIVLNNSINDNLLMILNEEIGGINSEEVKEFSENLCNESNSIATTELFFFSGIISNK
jgi:hypothetical protein